MNLYEFLYKHIRKAVLKVMKISIHNGENEPENGPFLVCANHISNADTICLGASLKHSLRFMAKAELFKIPVLKGFFKAMGAFPINRGAADVGAIKKAIGLLNNNEVVAIYPQGHRRPKMDLEKTEVHAGAAMIAYRAKVPVLPVYIKTKDNKLKLFRKVDVYIGKLITNEELQIKEGTKSEYENAKNIIFGEIIKMSKENK